MCVNKARILSPDEPEEKKWVDLINLSSNVAFMQINATVQDGQIRGHRMTQLQGQEAVEYQKKQLRQKKDSLIFTPLDAGKEKFAFKNLKQENDAYDPTQIKEEFDFLMDTETTGGRLYVNPMVSRNWSGIRLSRRSTTPCRISVPVQIQPDMHAYASRRIRGRGDTRVVFRQNR